MTIHQAMIAVMRDVDGLTKDQTSQGGFKYRGIDDVYNYLHDIMSKHGVFSLPTVTGVTREERLSKQGNTLIYTLLEVGYTFYAEDGSSVTCTTVGEAFDSGDKSAAKSLAIAHKYALFQAFTIPTNLSVDPDAEVHEVAQQTAPLALPPQLQVIEDFRRIGGLSQQITEYLEERGAALTEKQANQIIDKLEESK